MKSPFTETAYLEELDVEYHRFFDVSLDMLCISSFDGYFKKVNPAFEKTLGFNADELCLKSYMEFIHPDDIEITAKQVEVQLLTKQEVLNFENRYRCKDGSYKWLSWKSAPAANFMYAVARDITEAKLATEKLRQAKDELESANKELETFSYSIAHDLRAPARSIIGFSSLIFEDNESNISPESKGYLQRVLNSGKKMGILIDALLNISRLARQDLEPVEVDLSLIANELFEEMQSAEAGHKVEYFVMPNIHAHGDSTLLRIALANLLGNAWKYTSKQSRPRLIEFGQETTAGQKNYYVRDNGAGFDMQYYSKLFGLFQRLHTDREFEGTGIGLATVQKIIQRHGGKIWATSVVDLGATFYFRI